MDGREQQASHAATLPVAARVRDYCRQRFDPARLPPTPVLPLPDEPHVADWRRYAADGPGRVFERLQRCLPQLCVPIGTGVSRTTAYGQVVRRGEPFSRAAFGGTLTFRRPDALRLAVHDHPAGALPVLCTADRADFETLVRALGCRSEPEPIHPAVNAQLVSGFVNWDRVRRYRRAWDGPDAGWPAEMSRVDAQAPHLFRDRVVILAVAPYSGVGARALGLDLDEATWLDVSHAIRLEHEFTHYATKRLYGQARTHIYDEVMADCMGLSAGLGTFTARWALGCLGLDDRGTAGPGARIRAYRSGLDDRAFGEVCSMVVHAATSLERFAAAHDMRKGRGRFLLALTLLTLDQLAGDAADVALADACRHAGDLMAACIAQVDLASVPPR